MNRKQRVLTVIALIAFVGIGACHYLDWPPIVFRVSESVPYQEWRQVTYHEAQQSRENKYFDVIFLGSIIEQGGYTTNSGSFHPVTKDEIHAMGQSLVGTAPIPADAKIWFEVPAYAVKSYWHPYFKGASPAYAMIRDVRMPWFMLGVIYVGLFFLLADKKEKRP